MLTAKQARTQAKALARGRREMEKRQAREHLAALRRELKEARAARGRRLVAVKAQCRADRASTRQRVKELRASERARLLREIADARAGQVQACQIRRAAAIEESRGQKDAAHQALEAERRFRRELRRIDAGNRARKREAVRTIDRAARLGESDDVVRGNVPPELLPLWEKVKGRIRGGARISRTEAFLHYAHEHPAEVLAIVEADVDARIAELEKRERQAARLAKGRTPRKASAADLAGPWDQVG